MRTYSYFISDLHLGARYISDHRHHEQILVNWLQEIAPTAHSLYMLGDVLDYWYEYREAVPRGYIRFLGALAQLADSGVEIIWFKGNHDIWIYDYLPNEIGIKVIDGALTKEIDGKKFFMEHGDGVGNIPTNYKLMRKLFRNRFAQCLYGSIHPRWSIAFAHKWSSHSRLHGDGLDTDITPKTLEANHQLVRFVQDHSTGKDAADYYVFGHLHRIVDQKVNNARLIVLGDAFCKYSYGVWNGNNFSIERIKM